MHSTQIAAGITQISHYFYPSGDIRRSLVIAFLAVDVALIVLFILFRYAATTELNWMPRSLHLERQYGLGSVWNYGKFLLIIIGFAALAWHRRSIAFLSLAALFGLLLLDDYLEAHERLGAVIGERFGDRLLADLEPQVRGEIGVYLLLFVVAVAFVVTALVRCSDIERVVVRATIWLIVVLAAFGAGVDIVHAVVMSFDPPFGTLIDNIFVVLEDGGEMLALSAIVVMLAYWIPRLGS